MMKVVKATSASVIALVAPAGEFEARLVPPARPAKPHTVRAAVMRKTGTASLPALVRLAIVADIPIT